MKELVSSPIKVRHWYLMPATVFLVGILSLVLLFWVSLIREKQRVNSSIIEALMDAQICTATAHLWLEEAVSGDTTVDVKKFLAEMDKTISHIDVTLSGGASHNDLVSEPLKDPKLRAHAEEIKSLLLNFKSMGLMRLRNPEKSGIGTALDEQFDAAFKRILEETAALEDIVAKYRAINREDTKRLLIGIMAAWTLIITAATAGIWDHERRRRSAEKALHTANEQLLSQAEELTEHREHLAGLVEKRTSELTAANELLTNEIEQRTLIEETLRESEKQIRELGSRLLIAGEAERRRVSMELHDGLGQGLNVMKLQLGFVCKKLREDQGDIRQNCEELMEYTDRVIEDMRRLSRDLSPAILHDLGLTAALRWLVNSFAKNQPMTVKAEIAELDHFIPEDHWIIIYRVIQEALTNISKHAQADKVSLVIERHDEKVSVSVEDNGRGFDLQQARRKGSAEKGLGLATMDERVRIMDGVLDLWSQEGKGTRMTFSIPIMGKSMKYEIRNTKS
jgi:signal transduction histidine kinase